MKGLTVYRATWIADDIKAPEDVSCRNTRMMLLIAQRIWRISPRLLMKRAGLPNAYSLDLLMDERAWIPLWVFISLAEALHDLIGELEESPVIFDPWRFARVGGYAVYHQTWGKLVATLAESLAVLADPAVGYAQTPKRNLLFNRNKAYGVIALEKGKWLLSYEVAPALRANGGDGLLADACSDWWIQGLWSRIASIFGSDMASVSMRTRSYDPLAFFSGRSTAETQWAPMLKRLRALNLQPSETERGEFSLQGLTVGQRIPLAATQGEDGLFYLLGTEGDVTAFFPHWEAGEDVTIGDVSILKRGEVVPAHVVTRRIREAEIAARRRIRTAATTSTLSIEGRPCAQLENGYLASDAFPTGVRFSSDVAPERTFLVNAGEVWGPDLGFSAAVTWEQPSLLRRVAGVYYRLSGAAEQGERIADRTEADTQLLLYARAVRHADELQADLEKRIRVLEASRQIIARLLGEYLPPDLISRVLDHVVEIAGHDVQWDGVQPFPPFQKEATVLVCDLVSSSEIVAGRNAEDRAAILSPFVHTGFIETSTRGGWTKDTLGDGLVCVFGIGTDGNGSRDAFECAQAIQRWVQNQPELRGVRIGIATGAITVHPVGIGRADFAGEAGEIAARLEKLARPGEILLDLKATTTLGLPVQLESGEIKCRTFNFHRVSNGTQ